MVRRRCLLFLTVVIMAMLRANAITQQPVARGTATLEGIVTKLGAAEPVVGAEVELARIEGTTSAPLAQNVAQAFANALDSGNIPATGAPLPILSPEIQYVRTGGDGRFAFKNLKAGGYRLVAAHADGSYYPAEYGQRDPRGRGITLRIGDGENVRSTKLEMATTGAITGRVVDADGDPMGHALVLALEPAFQEGRATQSIRQAVLTDERGDFRFFWLPPGLYYVAAKPQDRSQVSGLRTGMPGRTATGYQQAEAPVVIRQLLPTGEIREEIYGLAYYGGSTPDKALPIELRSGATYGAVDISLGIARMPSHHIKGVLIDGQTGRPIPAVPIHAIPRQVSPSLIIPNSVTDARGAFDLSGVVAGSYRVFSPWLKRAAADPSSGQTATQSLPPLVAINIGEAPGDDPRVSYALVDVTDSNVENLRLISSPAIAVRGQLTIEGRSQGVADPELVKIRLWASRALDTLGTSNALRVPPNVTGPNSVTSPDGSVLLLLAPGEEYRITATDLPKNGYIKSARIGAVDLLVDGLRLSSVPDSPIQVVVATDIGDLTGLAVDSKRDPMPNVTMVLVPDSPALRKVPERYKTVATDSTGRFRITAPAGDYKIFAWEYAPTDSWQDPRFLQAYESFGKLVRIAAGGSDDMQVTAIPAQR